MESSKGAKIMEISSFVPVTFQEGERETGLDLKKLSIVPRERRKIIERNNGPRFIADAPLPRVVLHHHDE